MVSDTNLTESMRTLRQFLKGRNVRSQVHASPHVVVITARVRGNSVEAVWARDRFEVGHVGPRRVQTIAGVCRLVDELLAEV